MIRHSMKRSMAWRLLQFMALVILPVLRCTAFPGEVLCFIATCPVSLTMMEACLDHHRQTPAPIYPMEHLDSSRSARWIFQGFELRINWRNKFLAKLLFLRKGN